MLSMQFVQLINAKKLLQIKSSKKCIILIFAFQLQRQALLQLTAAQVNQQIQLMINKKLSGLFLRKEAKKQEQKPAYFDESAFHCKLISKGINTDLIKIQTQIKQTGEPLDQIKCKWYVKNSRDFKEIQEVHSTYYQPCLDDVGSSICVQIQPFIEGKKYNGITIMEQTAPIEIDRSLELKLDEFLQQKCLKLDGRIQNIYSQNEKYESLELPLEVKIQIRQSHLSLFIKEKLLEKIMINQQFPNVQFIRKSFSTILFNYNQKQSMKLSLNNNFNRDFFALVIRTCSAHSDSKQNEINPQKNNQKIQQISLQSISSAENLENIIQKQCLKTQQTVLAVQNTMLQVDQKPKSQEKLSSIQSLQINEQHKEQRSTEKVEKNEEKQSSTKFILKFDELNKQLKSLKRSYEDLKHNYNIQKQAKCQIQISLSQLKRDRGTIKKERDEALAFVAKFKQLKENNRFYKNQVAILKKQLKEQQDKVGSLQQKLKKTIEQKDCLINSKDVKVKKQMDEIRIIKAQCQRKIELSQGQIEKYKGEYEKLLSQNNSLRRKIQSIASEKGISKVQAPEKNVTHNLDSDEKVKQLELKLKNLQMLLKYKNSHSQNGSNFQILVNKLTETVSQKELQLIQMKKINKSLLQQLKQFKQKSK